MKYSIHQDDTKCLRSRIVHRWDKLQHKQPLIDELEYWKQQATNNTAAMVYRDGNVWNKWSDMFQAPVYKKVKNTASVGNFIDRCRNGYRELWWFIGGIAHAVGVEEYAQQIVTKLCMAWGHEVYFEYGTPLMTDRLWVKQAFLNRPHHAKVIFGSTNKEMAHHLLIFKNRKVERLKAEIMMGDTVGGWDFVKGRLDERQGLT